MDHDKKGKRLRFVAEPEFDLHLPEIPFDPKLIILPTDPSVGAEKPYVLGDEAFPVLPPQPHGYGTMCPIGSTVYDGEDDADLALCADSEAPSETSSVPIQASWLKKTLYIDHEFKDRGMSESDRLAALSPEKLASHTRVSESSSADEIAASFHPPPDPSTLRHRSKPNVRAVSVRPVLPDFDHWQHEYAVVVFDGEPPRHAFDDSVLVEESDVIGEGISASNLSHYMLPKDLSRKQQFLFQVARDYKFETREAKDNVVLETVGDSVFFTPCETRTTLVKRIKRKGTDERRILCAWRDPTENETKRREERSKLLEREES